MGRLIAAAPGTRGVVIPALIAIVSVAAATGAKLALARSFGPEVHLPLLFAPIIISAAVAGSRGAIVSTILASFCYGWFFLEPTHTLLTWSKLLPLGVFAAEGLLLLPILHAMVLLRRRLDRVEHENENRFRKLVQCNLVGIAFSDTSGRLIDCNDAFLQIVGRGREQVIDGAICWRELVAPEHADAPKAALAALRDGGAFEPIEAELLRPDGTRVPVMVGGALLEDTEAAVNSTATTGHTHVGCFVLDTSQIKQAESLLRNHRDELEAEVRQRTLELSRAHIDLHRSHDLLSAVVEGIEDAIFVKDRAGRYVMVNSAAARMMNRPPESLVGHNDAELFPGAGEIALEVDRRVIESATATVYEQEVVLPTGARRTLLTRKVPHRDHAGHIIGLIGIAHDITDRKATELANKAANAAKDRFLAILSHELRTPLTPVLAIASAMEADAATPDFLREDLQMIRRNVEIETRLIDDLLDVTRIANGKLELHRERVEVCRLIDDVVGVCSGEITAKRLQLDVQNAAGAAFVHGDGARLRQVLWNLLKNAVKFTGEGGQIALAASVDSTSGQLCVRVSDTGIGIAPEVLGKIFSTFEQGDPSITRHFGGLGLGLALSKGLTEAHGGSLSAHSDGIGRGATFTLLLPTCAAPLSVSEDNAAASAETRESSAMRVLLVEDHADTAYTLSRVLRSMDCHATIAGTFAEARRMLNSTARFDLLISDIHLPDGSGLDLAREKPQALAAVALSGSGMVQDVRESNQAGFHEHLVKPVTYEQLQQVVERFRPARAASNMAVWHRATPAAV